MRSTCCAPVSLQTATGAHDARQVHVDLHLRGVLGLRQNDTLGGQFGEALDLMGLELQHMLAFRGLDVELAAGLGIDIKHGRPDGTQGWSSSS